MIHLPGHRFGDEYDEWRTGINTRTLVLSVVDLQNPTITGTHIAAASAAIDHNQYVLGKYVFQVGTNIKVVDHC
jgi:hypothetical protein